MNGGSFSQSFQNRGFVGGTNFSLQNLYNGGYQSQYFGSQQGPMIFGGLDYNNYVVGDAWDDLDNQIGYFPGVPNPNVWEGGYVYRGADPVFVPTASDALLSLGGSNGNTEEGSLAIPWWVGVGASLEALGAEVAIGASRVVPILSLLSLSGDSGPREEIRYDWPPDPNTLTTSRGQPKQHPPINTDGLNPLNPKPQGNFPAHVLIAIGAMEGLDQLNSESKRMKRPSNPRVKMYIVPSDATRYYIPRRVIK